MAVCAPDDHYLNQADVYRQFLPKVTAFDLLINNADRKGGPLLLDPEGKLWLIDHGLSFHPEDKLRTVVWDCAGDPIPELLLGDIEHLHAQLLAGDMINICKPIYPHRKLKTSSIELLCYWLKVISPSHLKIAGLTPGRWYN